MTDKLPDLHAILGRVGRARAVIETACRVMEQEDCTDEVWTLRTGLDLLRAAYNELDRAIGNLSSDAMLRENETAG